MDKSAKVKIAEILWFTVITSPMIILGVVGKSYGHPTMGIAVGMIIAFAAAIPGEKILRLYVRRLQD